LRSRASYVFVSEVDWKPGRFGGGKEVCGGVLILTASWAGTLREGLISDERGWREGKESHSAGRQHRTTREKFYTQKFLDYNYNYLLIVPPFSDCGSLLSK